MLVFEEKRKTGVPAEKCLENGKRTSNSLSCLIVEASEKFVEQRRLTDVQRLAPESIYFFLHKQARSKT